MRGIDFFCNFASGFCSYQGFKLKIYWGVAFFSIENWRNIEKWGIELQSQFWASRPVRACVGLLDRHSLAGFQGVSIGEIMRFLLKEINMSHLLFRANSISFTFFLSLFPLLIVIVGLIPYLPVEQKPLLAQLDQYITQLMPNRTGEWLFDTLKFFLNNKRSGVLSMGFFLALYFSSNGIMSLMRTFEKENPIFKKRNFFEKRFRAIGITMILGILLLSSVALAIFGTPILKWVVGFFKFNKSLKISLEIFRWLTVLLLVYFGTAFIYRFGVAMRRRVHFLSPGALLTTVGSVLTSIVYSFFIDNFTSYDKLYGAISSVMVLMLWIQANTIILILGFELNAAVAVRRDWSILQAQRDEEEANTRENDTIIEETFGAYPPPV